MVVASLGNKGMMPSQKNVRNRIANCQKNVLNYH